MYPNIQVYSQRKAVTPAARPIFASGMLCSLTRAAIILKLSGEQAVGDKGMQPLSTGNVFFNFLTDHENSRSKSFSSSFSVSSLSARKEH